MNGLFLQGGGAKGAFQAGVIYGLFKQGYKFNIVTGTSIGAINSYFLLTNNLETMKELWINIDEELMKKEKISGDVVENKKLINELYKLNGDNESIKSLYVNYVTVNKSSLNEEIVDIKKLDKNKRIECIKYSSLLPLGIDEEITIYDFYKKYDTHYLFEKFKIDLANNKYDGYRLDGGILNNNLLSPFINNKVKKLFIISLVNDYKIPDYILNAYDRSEIILFEPITKLSSKDTLRFEKEFCKNLFYEGYDISKKVKSQ